MKITKEQIWKVTELVGGNFLTSHTEDSGFREWFGLRFGDESAEYQEVVNQLVCEDKLGTARILMDYIGPDNEAVMHVHTLVSNRPLFLTGGLVVNGDAFITGDLITGTDIKIHGSLCASKGAIRCGGTLEVAKDCRIADRSPHADRVSVSGNLTLKDCGILTKDDLIVGGHFFAECDSTAGAAVSIGKSCFIAYGSLWAKTQLNVLGNIYAWGSVGAEESIHIGGNVQAGVNIRADHIRVDGSAWALGPIRAVSGISIGKDAQSKSLSCSKTRISVNGTLKLDEKRGWLHKPAWWINRLLIRAETWLMR